MENKCDRTVHEMYSQLHGQKVSVIESVDLSVRGCEMLFSIGNYAEGIITISTPGRLNSISNPFFDCYLAGVSRDAGEEQQQQCEVNTAGDNVYVWKLDAQGITCDASCACKLDDDQCLPF